ncbi:MAG TPA: hypothetical protein VHD84_02565 [Candidatus Saccharimonadales bacterium]|nr:hypothetical protein [Candidatus Saccharimonadales bacterium]
MAKRTRQQMLMQAWWVRAILAVVCLVLAYVFLLLATDSAKTLDYILTVVFLWLGVRNAVRSVRLVF